ncbi:hypothetical protein F3Y22_tig00111837pilonHSYRG00428 [Hibiscus syriacus]|uniref:Uncharacterized protein n=1 Tax=Hibiscus syriacus TaxID=106335 RepID=A0A6A2YFT1_HIBSY|nr:hypothetical protein F3Y22_tig00111837pilonHSYRG00428 [Hibiscus syriacus]
MSILRYHLAICLNYRKTQIDLRGDAIDYFLTIRLDIDTSVTSIPSDIQAIEEEYTDSYRFHRGLVNGSMRVELDYPWIGRSPNLVSGCAICLVVMEEVLALMDWAEEYADWMTDGVDETSPLKIKLYRCFQSPNQNSKEMSLVTGNLHTCRKIEIRV